MVFTALMAMVMVMVMVMMMRIVRKNLRQIAEVSVKVRNGETSKRDVGGQTALPLKFSLEVFLCLFKCGQLDFRF